MTRVSELTVEELMDLLKREMQDVVRAAVRDALSEPQSVRDDQFDVLDIPSPDVGEWPADLKLLSREEMYC